MKRCVHRVWIGGQAQGVDDGLKDTNEGELNEKYIQKIEAV